MNPRSCSWMTAAPCAALLAIALLAAGVQPGAAQEIAQAPEPQRPLTPPEQRYEAIRPLLRAAADGAALPYTDAARTAGTTEQEVRLWYQLYDNLGRVGLITPGVPDAQDVAQQMTGTWELASRTINGRRQVVRTEIHNRIVDPRVASADALGLDGTDLFAEVMVESLVLEEGEKEAHMYPEMMGRLHMGEVQMAQVTESGGIPFNIGAFFTMRIRTEPGSPLVTIDATGEVWGQNYPGLEKPMQVRIIQYMVRLGDTYVAVGGGEIVAGPSEALQVIGYDPWNYIHGVNGVSLIYGSYEFDTYDTHHKVADRALVEQPRVFWQQARERGAVNALRPQRIQQQPAPRPMPRQ
jgi:hypothetical protein